MRKLKLDAITLAKLLDDLDAADARLNPVDDEGAFYPYRVPALRVDLDISRDETESQIVPSRKLGPHGIVFLAGSLVHTHCPCRVHLVTIRNSWQTVGGLVATCRYLPGTAGVHELFVRFQRQIDPVSFAQTATRSRILAADDSRVSQALYARLLDTMNVDLTCVASGVEAIDRALSESYDLILMDLEMPELDGLSAVKLLRGKGYVRAIVAVSAMSEPEDRERCLAAGCDDFLAKPLTRETLASVVTRNKAEPLVSALLDDPRMTELIDNFVSSLPETINRLESSYGSHNGEELERVARALKGEAAGIGFGTITDAAVALEHAIRRGEDAATLRTRLTELIRLCMSARPATCHLPAPAREEPGESKSRTRGTTG
jgi:CheY-like chemotaxis protein